MFKYSIDDTVKDCRKFIFIHLTTQEKSSTKKHQINIKFLLARTLTKNIFLKNSSFVFFSSFICDMPCFPNANDNFSLPLMSFKY